MEPGGSMSHSQGLSNNYDTKFGVRGGISISYFTKTANEKYATRYFQQNITETGYKINKKTTK